MKILLAEDDPVALEGLQGLLAKWGYEVVVAHDGEEAERLLLKDDAPAVAILDWIMPKRTGLDVCRTFRTRNSGSPYVILVTTNNDKKEMLTAFESGVDDFISKPVNPPELRARLHAAERIMTLNAYLRERAIVAEEHAVALQIKNSVFDESITANSIADNKGVITECNAAFLQIWGYPDKTDVVGKPISAFLQNSADAEKIVAALNGVGKWEGDYTARRKDGSTFEAHGLATVLHASNGELIGYQSSVLDITARKQVVEALYKSEERFRVATRQATMVLAQTDREARYTWIHNPHPDFNPNTVLGRTDVELADNDGARKLFQIKKQVIQTGIGTRTEIVFTVSGGPRHYDFTIEPLHNEAGQVTGLTTSAFDITERKRVEDDLLAAKEAADAANRTKSDFLSSMSHELRTPLSAIIGFSELLEEKLFGELNPKQEEYVKDILGSGRHLLSLINDILDLAKIEAGKMELEMSKVPIAELLENSLVMVKEKCHKHGIRLTTDIAEPVKGLTIAADERKLKQVMFNLLSNAAKFTPDGGEIRVSANLSVGVRERKSDQLSVKTPILPNSHTPTLVISVSDTGIGIAKEHQEKVFEEFYQVDGANKGKTPGSGLGLALVKRIVEQHGGRVWLESQGEGKGSTFYFTLPFSPPASGSVLVQAIREQLEKKSAKPGEFALFLFTLDTEAISKAIPASASSSDDTLNDMWTSLAGKVRTLGFESAFLGNEFIIMAASGNKAEDPVQEKLRRLLKNVLFQKAPSAVADFSCGMVTWPSQAAGADELLNAARKAQAPERERIAAKHIVIVDDESLVRGVLLKQLKQQGFTHCDEASGGEELFGLIRSQVPDLILLDIAMSGMNGYEVIGRLKGHIPTAEIPVLILSGRDLDSEELRKKSPTTAIHVLAKPVGPDALNKWVLYLL